MLYKLEAMLTRRSRTTETRDWNQRVEMRQEIEFVGQVYK